MSKILCFEWVKRKLNKINRSSPTDQDYRDIERKKTRSELVLISLVVFGIEICFAAETAFVSPIILKLGVNKRIFKTNI